VILFPKAKINLGLRITGKRPDGYHDIETLFYPVPLCDALEFVISPEPLKKDLITVTGLLTDSNPDDNLVMQGIRKIREKYSFPWLKIHLHKSIPAGAGLGGGSSDASTILKAINRCFRLNIEEVTLKKLALELGSDCPFFIDCIPAAASGRGEVLSPINPVLSGLYILLLNPGIGINTKEAYSNCLPAIPVTNLTKLIDRPISDWRNHILNDFEDYAFKKHPVIGEIKNRLYQSGAIFSLMSGSGSSVYGIFAGKPQPDDYLLRYVIYEGLL